MASSVIEVPNISCAKLGAAQPQLAFSFETNSFRLVFREQARTEVKWRTEKMTPQNRSANCVIIHRYLFSNFRYCHGLDNPPCPALVEKENQEVVSEDDGKNKNIGEALVHEVQ